MANQNSFDISIAFDAQELKNALDQTRREVQQRYDFKGVMAEVEEDGTTLTIHAESPDKVRALEEIIVGKLVKRNLSPKILGEAKDEDASGGTIRRRFPLVTCRRSWPGAARISRSISRSNSKTFDKEPANWH
jgi:uncharacterized protein YajQ (UPF0234 family)